MRCRQWVRPGLVSVQEKCLYVEQSVELWPGDMRSLYSLSKPLSWRTLGESRNRKHNVKKSGFVATVYLRIYNFQRIRNHKILSITIFQVGVSATRCGQDQTAVSGGGGGEEEVQTPAPPSHHPAPGGGSAGAVEGSRPRPVSQHQLWSGQLRSVWESGSEHQQTQVRRHWSAHSSDTFHLWRSGRMCGHSGQLPLWRGEDTSCGSAETRVLRDTRRRVSALQLWWSLSILPRLHPSLSLSGSSVWSTVWCLLSADPGLVWRGHGPGWEAGAGGDQCPGQSAVWSTGRRGHQDHLVSTGRGEEASPGVGLVPGQSRSGWDCRVQQHETVCGQYGETWGCQVTVPWLHSSPGQGSVHHQRPLHDLRVVLQTLPAQSQIRWYSE